MIFFHGADENDFFMKLAFSSIFSFNFYRTQHFLEKFSRPYISRVKFSGESKSELMRIGVKNKGKQKIENKQKNKDFEVKIDILYRYSDSGNRFSGKFHVDFMSPIFFQSFTCLSIIEI